MKIRNLTLALAGTALVFSACEKNPDPKVPADNANIALATILPNPDGMTGAAYLQLIRDEFPQNTNNNNGIPIPYEGAYPVIEGNDIFVFPGYMGDSKNELVKYTRVNGRLSKTGTMKLPPNSSATNIVFASAEKAYLSMAGLGRIAIFNPITMVQKGEIDLSSLGVSDNNPDPSAMLLRDGLLYVGLSQMVGGWVPPQDRPYSDIAIIDTQTDKLLKMITDQTSGISMPTRPIDRYSIFMDEKRISIFRVSVPLAWSKVIMPEYCVSRQERLSSTQRIAGPLRELTSAEKKKLRDLSLPSGM